MRACVYCKTRYKKNSGITFHKFPTEESLMDLWLANMQRLNWCPRRTDYLCSKHFTDDCFNRSVVRTNLKIGSIPTLGFRDNLTKFDKSVPPTSYEPVVADEIKIELKDIDDYHENGHPDETDATDPLGWTVPEVKSENIKHDHYYQVPLSNRTSAICASIRHDHLYENSPKITNIMLQRTRKSLTISRAKVKLLSQQVKRLKSTVTSLKKYIRLLEGR